MLPALSGRQARGDTTKRSRYAAEREGESTRQLTEDGTKARPIRLCK
jgi:hypothetical protein